jgi:hypothetical protein
MGLLPSMTTGEMGMFSDPNGVSLLTTVVPGNTMSHRMPPGKK